MKFETTYIYLVYFIVRMIRAVEIHCCKVRQVSRKVRALLIEKHSKNRLFYKFRSCLISPNFCSLLCTELIRYIRLTQSQKIKWEGLITCLLYFFLTWVLHLRTVWPTMAVVNAVVNLVEMLCTSHIYTLFHADMHWSHQLLAIFLLLLFFISWLTSLQSSSVCGFSPMVPRKGNGEILLPLTSLCLGLHASILCKGGGRHTVVGMSRLKMETIYN